MDVRVLLVDDQPRYMQALASVVGETVGFTVVGQAGTGEECLRLAPTLRADLVLLDVNLPGLDGVEVARRLRGGDAPPVVVLLSTYDEEAGERFVVESGANAYVTKSAFAPELLTRMWARWSA
ncbi:response regulator [Ornithinimicrobium cryptoxanthini]|uniref:response regulator n=1 Tax=Ornithinimicrobium cryptoxanthini TaxID=2934161 RepID=UPI002118092D